MGSDLNSSHLFAVLPWAGDLASLSLSFLICKMVFIIPRLGSGGKIMHVKPGAQKWAEWWLSEPGGQMGGQTHRWMTRLLKVMLDSGGEMLSCQWRPWE